jgi:membrane fusion protein (multidrug efflux system)
MRSAFRFVMLGLLGCSGTDWGSDEETSEPAATMVETRIAGPGTVLLKISTSAVVESEAYADLIPPTSGVVVSIAFDEGDAVVKGDVLAVLDNVALDAGRTRAEDEVGRLEAQLDELEDLRNRGAVSDREVEDVRYQLRTARVSAHEAVRTHGQTRITAPFDGVVAARNVRLGELAGTGTPAFSVVDASKLRVVTSLPERDLNRVVVGQRAHLASSYNEEATAWASVVRIAPVVDPSTGTFRVTLGVEQGPTLLRPGQFVSVDLEVERFEGILVIPKGAVTYDLGQAFAHVVEDVAATDEEEAHQIVRRIALSLGVSDTQNVQIVEGLVGGEDVVVLGQHHLREGARVRMNTVEDAPDPEGDEG